MHQQSLYGDDIQQASVRKEHCIKGYQLSYELRKPVAAQFLRDGCSSMHLEVQLVTPDPSGWCSESSPLHIELDSSCVYIYTAIWSSCINIAAIFR